MQLLWVLTLNVFADLPGSSRDRASPSVRCERTEGRPFRWVAGAARSGRGRYPRPVKTSSLPARLVFLSSLLLTAPPAHAVDPTGGEETSSSQEPKTLTDYLSDLTKDDAPVRVFAARTVRFETRRAVRDAEHRPPDSLASLDAQSRLVELQARAPAACAVALHYVDTVPPCAEILQALGRAELLPELRTARLIVTKKAAQARVDKAIAALEALPSEAPAPAPTPAVAP